MRKERAKVVCFEGLVSQSFQARVGGSQISHFVLKNYILLKFLIVQGTLTIIQIG